MSWLADIKPATKLLIAMGISGVLYFILAVYKRYAFYWWAIGGIVICLPIALVIDGTKKVLITTQLFKKPPADDYIFVTLYLIIYLGLWFLTKQSAISEEERAKQEKVDEAIFDGFLALKEKRVDDAYYIFRKGYLVDPDNPVIKTILSSFHKGKHGLVKEKKFFEWWYKLRYFFKRKKHHPHIKLEAIKDESPPETKEVEGRVVD